MGKNSSVYNKAYHSRKREELIAKLGGECVVCGIKQDLIVHRVYTPYNMGSYSPRAQTTLDRGFGAVNKFTPVSSTVLKERRKQLRNNPDNMVLLCYSCCAELVRIHGRKKAIGRKEISYFRGERSPLVLL